MKSKGLLKRKSSFILFNGLFLSILFSACGKQATITTLSTQDISYMTQSTTMVPETTLLPSKTETPSLTLSPEIIVTPVVTPNITQIPTLVPTPTPTPTISEVTLVAVGDDLIHKKVIDSGLKVDGTYNFDHIFEPMKEDFINADIAIINQETIFGTKEMGYSGYPRFCSPVEVGDAVRKAGFDVILHATNHVADRGVEGIENTLAYWEKYPQVKVLGIHKDAKSFSNITVIERSDIKIAMLNYTYGLNGLSLPRDKYYMVNDFNEQNMIRDIEKAKEVADFIIVFPHWGNEYQHKESKYQRIWAEFFAEQGVDLVIGSHPHVLEPVDWITSSTGHRMLVYYSLGNYVSTMDYTDRMLGGMANITLAKVNGKVYIKSASLTPIVTHYERGEDINLTVYKLSDYTQSLAQKHYILGNYRGKDFSLEKLQQLSQDIVGEWITKKIYIHQIVKFESSTIK
jgi:poly-gamma-glutamate synthesis protein (capsule biosynthesis protein)